MMPGGQRAGDLGTGGAPPTMGADGNFTPPAQGVFGGGSGIFTGGIMGIMSGDKSMTGGMPSGMPGGVASGMSSVPFIPGTLIKMPAGATVGSVMQDLDPGKLGIKLPSFVKAEDFTKVMQGQASLDMQSQDIIKALNPGKFGPMADPYAMSRSMNFGMDSMGNFLVQASEGMPGNPYITKAKALEDEGKYAEAAELLNDPNTPFAQYPDAPVHAYRAQLEAKAGNKQAAVNYIENALALAPTDDALYKKAGEIFKEAGVAGIKVFVNGVVPDFGTTKPVLENGRTLVPFRSLAETMGASVNWDQATQGITVVKGDKTVQMTIGSKTATVNGNPVTLDVEPKIVDGRTLVPLRFVGEGLDASVGYDQSTEIIKILPKATAAQ